MVGGRGGVRVAGVSATVRVRVGALVALGSGLGSWLG